MIEIDIDANRCKGCNICIEACAKKVFAVSKKRNSYGTTMPEVKKTEDCVACRMCESMCPDGAISISKN